MTYAAILIGLLGYAILTVWVEESWAWAAFQVGIFGLTAAWTVAALIRNRAIRASRILFPPLAAILWGVVQIANRRSIYAFATWKSVLAWSTWLAAMFLAIQVLQEYRARDRFLRLLAIFGCVLSVAATIQLFTSGGRIFWIFPSGYTDFVLGPFTNRNQFAAFIELLLPVALAEAVRDRPRRLLWSGAAGGMFAAVIASASRCGLVIAAGEIVAVLVIAAVNGQLARRDALRLADGITLLAAVFTIVVGWQPLWKRLTAPDPYAGRREMLISSMQMIRERPWTGFGLGTWPIAYPRFALYDDGSFVNQAHNDWAQWTVEGGMPLLAIMLALAILAIRPACASLWGLGIVAVLVHAFVDFPFQQRPALGAWFFVLLGAVFARAGPERSGRHSPAC